MLVPASVVMPVTDWPTGDQAAWQRALAGGRGPFRSRSGGGSRNRFTLRNRRGDYGRWLGFLRDTGQLDPAAPPGSRVTRERLDAYILDLQAHGNGDQTIVTRFEGLAAALKMLEPAGNFRWVVIPGGVHISHHLQMRRKDQPIHHSATLLDWAEELFAAGLAHRKPRCRRVLVREAVAVGMLVMPAPRLEALWQFRIGRNLQRHGEGWSLDEHADINKNRKGDWCPLLDAVTPMIDRYLAVERVELLEGNQSDRLFIAQGGGTLPKDSISRRIRILSRKRFGRAFGPHHFRRCLATTNATDNFTAPHDASTLLGHTSERTTNRHYNFANATAATHRHADRRRRMREKAAREAREDETK